MKLKELKIHTFAGINNQTVSFDSKLNVLAGPNEAGKSTVIKALSAVLLTPTNQTPAKAKKQIADWLPLDGGDSVEVELTFEVEGRSYGILKRWGPNPESRLTLPDATLINCPETAQQRLQQLLPAQAGTVRNILISGQGNLEEVFDELEDDSEATQDLAGILRASCFATDGLSLEKLSATLDSNLSELQKKWDMDANEPMRDTQGRSRGIDRKWSNGRGKILEAFYDLEYHKQELVKSERYEDDCAELGKKLSTARDSVESLIEKVTRERPIVQDLRKREGLERENADLEKELAVVKKVSREWPTLEERVKNLNERQGENRKQIEEVGQELGLVERYHQSRAAEDLLARLQAKDEEIADAKKRLDSTIVVTDDELARLNRFDIEKRRLTASLEAARLQVEFRSINKDIELNVAVGLEGGTSRSIAAGQAINLEAGGSVSLRCPEWELLVKSGEIDFDELERSIAEIEENLSAGLKALGVQDIAELARRHATFSEKKSQLEKLETQRAEILDGRKVQDQEDLVAEFKEVTPPRTQEVLTDLKARLMAAANRIEQDLENSVSQLQEWRDTYETWDGVQQALADLTADLREVTNKLADLSFEAREMKDPDAFIISFENADVDLQAAKDRLRDLEAEKCALEQQAQEMSSEEIQQAIERAEQSFNRLCREARALTRIQWEFERLRDRLDSGTLTPWIEELAGFVNFITLGRYEQFDIDQGEFLRSDGMTIPFHLLSQGTKGALGIAVRLSMANRFVGNSGGFLILDDPLVDLDPNRQSEVAKTLQRFSNESQVIVATCHPAHVERLGGAVLDLGNQEDISPIFNPLAHS